MATRKKNKITTLTCLKLENNKKKKNLKKARSWSDLPTEILEYIMAGLYLKDIESFHAVCKRWRSIERPPNHLMIKYGYLGYAASNQIPWLMIYNFHPSFTLIEPSSLPYKETHSIKIQGIGPYDNIKVCSTKLGWLLLSCTRPFLQTSLFLYSPFINERIDLPALDFINFDVATFSSVPTSPDCIFFVVGSNANEVTISICRQGDMAWSTSSFSCGFMSINNVVYSKGMFYCSNIQIKGLAAFDVAQQSWRVLYQPKSIMDARSLDYFSFMVGDEDGELLLVLLHNLGCWVLVFKFDRSEMMWLKVEDLKDKSLFVSLDTSLVVSKNKRTEKMMDRIYYCLPYINPKFYSLKAGKSYRCQSTYGDLRPKRCFWIEPPY